MGRPNYFTLKVLSYNYVGLFSKYKGHSYVGVRVYYIDYMGINVFSIHELYATLIVYSTKMW